jgi:hypothetical protein
MTTGAAGAMTAASEAVTLGDVAKADIKTRPNMSPPWCETVLIVQVKQTCIQGDVR